MLNKLIEYAFESPTDNFRSRYYILSPVSRRKLLQKFPPKYDRVIAHHITWKGEFNPAEKKFPPIAKNVKVVGYVDDGKIEAVIVSVNGDKVRDDGNYYHITLSLDPTSGARPIDSERLAKKHRHKRVLLPLRIDVFKADKLPDNRPPSNYQGSRPSPNYRGNRPHSPNYQGNRT